MKDLPIIFNGPMVTALLNDWKTNTRRLANTKAGKPSFWRKVRAGDVLWVREAHYVWTAGNQDGSGKRISYRVTDPDAPCSWTPGIHMPRFASRLTLECIADARVQRLQDISEEDGVAEGATSKPNLWGYGNSLPGWSMDWREPYAETCLGTARLAFANFINSLHGGKNWNLKPANLWHENPEVVALTFKVHVENVDTYLARVRIGEAA